MKFTTAFAAALIAGSTAMAAPAPSEGLFELATTGWANTYAAETNGVAFDETGGMPGEFIYDTAVFPVLGWAKTALNENEFLAPHFAISANGDVTVMVAPHLLIDGEVMKGAGPDDNFIVISVKDGVADVQRYDYSEDIAQ